MRAATRAVLPLCLVWASIAQAQTLTAVPSGRTAEVRDTIYDFVVDPADHPDEASVLLLDDGVVRYASDGTGRATYRYVAQILKQDAVAAWAEHTFVYNPERERFRLDWARVLDLEGNVISDAPLHTQETEIPAPEGAPVFTNQRQVRISLAGVAPGTIVDYSYTTEIVAPVLEGDFFGSWFFNPGTTIRRSRLVLDLPAELDARLHPVDVTIEPRVTHRDGRIVREWSMQDIAMRVAEPFMPDSNGVTSYLRYSGGLDWPAIGAWYAGLAQDRYAMTPALEQQLAKLVADATTLEDSLRAVHRWVAQDVRYVSLSLGIGGYQPRMPADVLSTLSGDCKDKATLFITFARHMGVDAYPVLATTGSIDPSLPSIRQFDHLIAGIDIPDGPLYVDLTASLVPFGELPGALHGDHGLVIRDGRDAELVRFDDPPATAARRTERLIGTLDADGAFTGTYEEINTGWMQYALRQPLAQDLTAEQQQGMAQAIASGLFSGGQGDSLQLFDGRDLEAEVAVSLHVSTPRATTQTPEGAHIFAIPLPTFGNPDLLHYMETHESRTMPFDIAQVSGDNMLEQEIRVRLPDGWTAVLPEGVEAASRFGSYRSSYALENGELRIAREYIGGRGIAPASAIDELIDWLRAMVQDDTEYLVLRPAS